MEFRHLEIFVAVAKWNSFSEAARQLCLSQPAVTTNIQALEKELQTCLLTRSTKKLALTSEGKRFYEYAANLLNLRQKALADFSQEQDSAINIGASTIPSSYILPQLMSQYRKLHPKTRFKVWQSDSLGVLERLQEGSLDLGLVGTWVENKDYHLEPFYKDELVLAVPASAYYVDMQKKGSLWPQILKEPWIWRENSSGTAREAEKYLKHQGVEQVQKELNIVAVLNDQQAVIKAIREGLGASIVSKLAAADFKKSILTFSLENNYRYLYLVTLKNKFYSSEINNFIKFIRRFYFKNNNKQMSKQ